MQLPDVPRLVQSCPDRPAFVAARHKAREKYAHEIDTADLVAAVTLWTAALR